MGGEQRRRRGGPHVDVQAGGIGGEAELDGARPSTQITMAAVRRASIPGDTMRRSRSRAGSVTTTEGCKRRLPALGAARTARRTASRSDGATGWSVMFRMTRRLRIAWRTGWSGALTPGGPATADRVPRGCRPRRRTGRRPWRRRRHGLRWASRSGGSIRGRPRGLRPGRPSRAATRWAAVRSRIGAYSAASSSWVRAALTK